MTTKQTAPRLYASKYPPEEQFPQRPRRTDMQNFRFRERPGHAMALEQHFGNPDTTLIFGDIPVRHTFQRGLAPSMLRYPDLLVAFDVDPAEAIARRGFAIDDQGKPPDFVLEIASLRTAENDYTYKRRNYAAYGIPEYWRFDNTGGNLYPAGLAGDRLADGEYQPIAIVQVDENHYWGHSDALNLDLCWEQGQLRWWDPVSRRYLRTHGDEINDRIAAEARAHTAEARAHTAEAEAARNRECIRRLEEELGRRSS